MQKGKLVFRLHGEKLAGLWELVRIAKPGDKQDAWMLFKKRDEWARPLAEYDVIAALPDSVVAKPLGLVEAREPRGTGVRAVAAVADAQRPRPRRGRQGRPAGEAGAAARHARAAAPPQGDWLVETKFDGYRLWRASTRARRSSSRAAATTGPRR